MTPRLKLYRPPGEPAPAAPVPPRDRPPLPFAASRPELALLRMARLCKVSPDRLACLVIEEAVERC